MVLELILRPLLCWGGFSGWGVHPVTPNKSVRDWAGEACHGPTVEFSPTSDVW